MSLHSLLILALKGLLPDKVSWISEVVLELLEEVPQIIGSKLRLDEAGKETIRDLIADIADDIPEISSAEAGILAEAIVIIVDKIYKGLEKKRLVKGRRRRKQIVS